MTYTYYSAWFKCLILRTIGLIFHPWISDMGVRVYQHYPKYEAFCQIYPQALKANKEGLKYIVVHESPQPVATNIPSKVTNIKDFKRKPRKPKK